MYNICFTCNNNNKAIHEVMKWKCFSTWCLCTPGWDGSVSKFDGKTQTHP